MRIQVNIPCPTTFANISVTECHLKLAHQLFASVHTQWQYTILIMATCVVLTKLILYNMSKAYKFHTEIILYLTFINNLFLGSLI